MSNHDEHYSNKKIEPIDVIEQIIINTRIPMPARYSVAQASKYVLRAGTKEGEDWKKDIDKAINYLTRARTGKWAQTEEEHCILFAKDPPPPVVSYNDLGKMAHK